MGKMAKQDEYVRYTIRVPADLYRRIQEAAGEKSANAEIVQRLEDTFSGAYVLLPAQIRERIEESARQNRRGFGAELIGSLQALFPPSPFKLNMSLEERHRRSLNYFDDLPEKIQARLEQETIKIAWNSAENHVKKPLNTGQDDADIPGSEGNKDFER